MQRNESSSLVTLKEVMRRVGVRSRETIARWVRRGSFPSPIIVGGGQLRWLSTEVDQWILRRAEARLIGHAAAFAPPGVAAAAPDKPKDTLPNDLSTWAAAKGDEL